MGKFGSKTPRRPAGATTPTTGLDHRRLGTLGTGIRILDHMTHCMASHGLTTLEQEIWFDRLSLDHTCLHADLVAEPLVELFDLEHGGIQI